MKFTSVLTDLGMYHRTTNLLSIKMEHKQQKGSIHIYPSPSLYLILLLLLVFIGFGTQTEALQLTVFLPLSSFHAFGSGLSVPLVFLVFRLHEHKSHFLKPFLITNEVTSFAWKNQ